MGTKTRICLSVVVVSLALVAVWTVLAVPGTAVAKGKPGGDGGGGGNDPVCVAFSGAGVQSDDGTDYCNNKKQKVQATLTQAGSLDLVTGQMKGTGEVVGRSLFVDFGEEITLEGSGLTFRDTDELPADIQHYERFQVGAGQLDLRAMDIGEERDDVNLWIVLTFHDSDGQGTRLVLFFDPDYHAFGCPTEGSTYAKVKRTGPGTWEIEVDPADHRARLIEGHDGVVYCHDGLEITVPAFTATVTLQ